MFVYLCLRHMHVGGRRHAGKPPAARRPGPGGISSSPRLHITTTPEAYPGLLQSENQKLNKADHLLLLTLHSKILLIFTSIFSNFIPLPRPSSREQAITFVKSIIHCLVQDDW